MEKETIRDNQPSYYAIIPATVRYDKELCPNAKLLYGEITALSNKEGYCWSTNNYFSKLYEVSTRTISRWVNELVEKGYLISKLIRDENTKQILERRLYIADFTLLPIKENVKRGMDKNVLDNTTRINTTSNNIYSTEKKIKNEERKKPPTLQEIEDFIAEKKLSINAKDFYDHYYNNEWIDSQGKLITKSNYRLKVSMWSKNNFQTGNKKQELEKKAPKPFIPPKPIDNPIDPKKAIEMLKAIGIETQKKGTMREELLGRKR